MINRSGSVITAVIRLESEELKLSLPKFSLRALLLMVLVVGIVIPATLTGLELSRFNAAKESTLDSLLGDNPRQGRAIATAVSRLSFLKRHDSIIAFAGLHHQSNGCHVLFVDWASYRSDANSILITLHDGRSITCPMNELDHRDSYVYYHYSILMDEFGLDDGTDIKHVELGRDGDSISESVAPEKWTLPWLRNAG